MSSGLATELEPRLAARGRARRRTRLATTLTVFGLLVLVGVATWLVLGTSVLGVRTVTVTPGSERDLRADLGLLAIGFDGTEPQPLLDQFGLTRNRRGVLDARADWQTDTDGVFVAGDMHRGASLIVWAIAEGRACAAGVDRWLMGETSLPAPVLPTTRPLT